MFAVSRMVFFIAFFNLRRRNNAIYRQKPINNNILRVVDPTGCELIVTGRGLGFGVKPGYKIEAETVERSYRMTSLPCSRSWWNFWNRSRMSICCSPMSWWQ